jgi:hypothetical protein
MEEYGVIDNEFYFSRTGIPIRVCRPVREADEVSIS